MSLINAFRQGLAPIKRVKANKWAEQNIVMTTETSAFPGPWDNSFTPYLNEPLECLSPTDPAQRVVFAKGVQIGATAAGILASLCYVDTDPCPIMYVMPTLDLAKGLSQDKLQPMIESSQSLLTKIKSNKSRSADNKILRKKFPGGSYTLSGANSPASLRSKSVRVILLDEVDAYPANVGKEGSAVSLAEKRSVSFGKKKKIGLFSTPILDGASVIWMEYLLTDQRKFFLPCPKCGAYQHLKRENLIWPQGLPQRAKYRCEHCQELIDETSKPFMLAKGEWRSTVPERRDPYLVGFHLNSLYSPHGMLSWGEIAADYEKAMLDYTVNQNDDLLRTFTNTIEGLPYKAKGDAPAWEDLFKRANNYPSHKRNEVLDPVLVITAGVDVQKDRIEMEIVGWGEGARSWSIDKRVIEGEVEDKEVQEVLKRIFDSKWTRKDGKVIPIHKVCFDSNYNTTNVYRFIKSLNTTQVVPIRGMDTLITTFSAPRQVNNEKHGKDLGRLMFYNVGSSVLKAELYQFLGKTRGETEWGPPGYCHFPAYEEHYFKSLTAESFVTKWEKNKPKTSWDRHYRQNEMIDCRNYARAALGLSGYEEYGDSALFSVNNTYRYKDDPVKVEKKKRISEYWS